MEDVVVPVALFVTITIMVVGSSYFRYRSRRELQQTLRDVLASGRDIDSVLLAELMASLQPKDIDLRRAAIAVAISVGTVMLAFGVGEPDAFGPLLGVAAFPFAIGIAYYLLWRTTVARADTV